MKKEIKGFLVVGSALLCGFVFAHVNSSEYENPPPTMMQIGEYEDVEVNLPPGAVILKPANTTPRRKELPLLQPTRLPEPELHSQLLGAIEEHPWMRPEGIIDTMRYHGDPAYYFSDSNAFYAVRFTPASPCSIMAIGFLVYDPIPGSYDSLFWIYAWHNGVDNLPDIVIHGPQEYKYTHDGWQWVYLTPPKSVTNVFHLGYLMRGGSGPLGGPLTCGDAGPPNYSGPSSVRPAGGSWMGPTYYNWMIEAIVKYPLVPPAAPYITQVLKSGNNAIVTWNKVLTDTLGYPENMDYYIVYRNTSPSFVPGSSDSIGAVDHPDTVYVDTGALSVSQNYYYLVKAVDAAHNRSKRSSMGYVFHKFVNENATTTDRNWVSLPWYSNYSTVDDLTDDLSPAGDPLIKVVNLRDDNLYESWLWDPDFLEWYGINFNITSGRGYEMVTVSDDTIILVGSNKDDGLVLLNENPTTTDRNWVSIPYNHVYTTASDITTEYAPAGDPLVKLVNLRDDNLYESWLWDPDFAEWYGADFVIERGRGYEFVTIIDTTWNPIEFSNEAKGDLLVLKQSRKSQTEVNLGKSSEPDRTPVWVAESREAKSMSVADAKCYKPAVGTAKHVEAQASAPHIVRTHVDAKDIENLLFTAYRPDKPYDVLTENMTGCGVVQKGDEAAIWFDVGNFRTPWKDGDEIMLIVEAVRDGRGYCAALSVNLNAKIDIQDLDGITLVPIPKPAYAKGRVQWAKSNDENVIGYSLYHDTQRVNNEIITENNYLTRTEVSLKPVFKGGYETVYSSQQGTQSTPDAHLPLSYAFSIFPNPFTKTTAITYALPHQSRIDIALYDASGRLVKTVVSADLEPGYYTDTWSGEDDMARKVAAGVYFITLTTDGHKSYNKVIFVR